jgi:hypothetical protein
MNICHHNHRCCFTRYGSIKIFMKEIIIYSIAAIASLAILAYSIHMFVGGLVSPGLERILIIGGTLVGVVVIGLMARDVMRTRKKNAVNGNNDR